MDFIPEQEVLGDREARPARRWLGRYPRPSRIGRKEMRAAGKKRFPRHFNYINPLPHGVYEIFSGFRKIVVCELNEGQFANYMRMSFPAVPVRTVQQGAVGFRSRKRNWSISLTNYWKSSHERTQIYGCGLQSDQEVRWCPGCGDYAVLSAIQRHAADSRQCRRGTFAFRGGLRYRLFVAFPLLREHIRFPRHTRPCQRIATGLKTANPDLSVFVMTGDGDSLAIGGNHFIHSIRRNIDLNVVLFTNEIYGLTKGQYCRRRSSARLPRRRPYGTVERPFNPGEL